CPTNHQWVDTPWVNGAYSIDAVPESNEMKAVVELIANISAKYSVDSDRIYAAGISMGGFATWDALMRHNDLFAAGIPVCGGGDVSQGEALKETPIFTFHAVDDTAVPVAGTRETVNAIKKAGGTKIEYTEYASGGHGIWNQAFATKGLLTKLFECKLSDRYPVEESSEPESIIESTPISEAVNEEGGLGAGLIIGIIAAAVIILATVVLLLLKGKKK
ncbi:MAG: prolyl oligopeptidase family serine peptidase, partial [Clostridia bacterium]|nr:prolyl oligopeptidase family serine peptidase [Clostridia bacterium]